MKKLFYTITVLMLSTTVFAQAPQGFNYQAVARDGDNNILANTALDVKIGLLQGSETGTLIWEEIHTVTTNDLGLFTLKIGDTNATNSDGIAATFSDINQATGSYYMKVQVDDGGVYVDMGSTELLSVPYALFAEEGNEGPAGPPGDPVTDDQILSINGHDLTISGGNMVSLPDSVIDDDADPINDSTILHKTLLRLSGGEHDKLFITNKNAVTIIDEEIWFVKKVILFAPEESILIKNNRIVIDICLYLAYNLNVET